MEDSDIEILDRMVIQLYHEGRFREALPYAIRSRELSREIFGENHPHYAECLNSLAVLYESLGVYGDAIPLYEQAREILYRELGEDHPRYATCLNNAAVSYWSIGAYEKALALFEQAIEIRLQTLGAEHPDYASSLSNLAALYRSQGLYKKALSLYEQVRGIDRRALGESHPDYATYLNNIAGLHTSMGAFEKALPLYEQAREIRLRALGENHPDYATDLNNIGSLYRSIGAFEKALPLYEQAREIRRQALGVDHPHYAQSLNNLAGLYRSMGDYKNALPLLEEAREILHRVIGEDHSDYALCLNNIAVLHWSMGAYEKALPLLERAREIRRQSLGVDHPHYASNLHNLAALHMSTGAYDQALPLLEEAKEIHHRVLGADHPNYALSLNSLAMFHAGQGRTETAYDLFRRAATIEDRVIGRVFGSTSNAERTAFLSTIRVSLDVFLSLVDGRLSDQPHCVQAAFDLTLRRKGLTAEALAIQRESVIGGKYPALAADLDRLADTRTLYVRAITDGPVPGDEGREKYDALVHELESCITGMEAALARQIPEMDLALRIAAVDHRVITDSLPPSTRLLEFVRYTPYVFDAVPARGEQQWRPARYLVFVVPDANPNGIQMIDLGEAEIIDRLIQQYLHRIRSRRGYAAGQKTFDSGDEGKQLSAALINSLGLAIADADHLIISPDGLLATLPFEVLPDGDATLLIDRYLISYVSAGRDLVRLQGQEVGQTVRVSPSPPLLIADPDYDLSDDKVDLSEFEVDSRFASIASALRASSIRFERLPNTRAEAQSIGERIGVRPLLDVQALESTLKAIRSPSVLHIATHGFFLHDDERESNPVRGLLPFSGADPYGGDRLSHLCAVKNPLLRSGLALAGANTWLDGRNPPPEAEDGILTAEDVTGMDLTDTELVVLSACETGLGEARVGDGVYGLRRSFAIAGASTLVMSLWKVPDEETKHLMIELYTRLMMGEGRAEALRSAQLSVKARNPHPYYWGAFICQGDTRPLTVSIR